MDKDEVLGSRLITEQDMICKDCIWNGEQEDMVPSMCMKYNLKPLNILSRVTNVECDYLTTQEDLD